MIFKIFPTLFTKKLKSDYLLLLTQQLIYFTNKKKLYHIRPQYVAP